MSINELFGTTTATVNHNARNLPGTAELTNIASAAAHRIIKAMEVDIEHYRPVIQESSTDSKKMEALIDDFRPLHNIGDEDMLANLNDELVESMLKSQQSKRSRTKSKLMTLDNYISLLTATIAEDILRELYNKPKSAGGFQRAAGSVDYTGAQLEMFAEDQEALRREIRNIQSKKSIMRSKADFTESDERWLALLKAEQQLKDLRVGGRSKVVEVDTTKNALAELLGNADIEHLKAADARELLEKIQAMAIGATDDEIAEEI